MINSLERNILQNQFNEVIKYSQQLNIDINSDLLFCEWESAKSYFIKTLFNGKLSYTYPKKISFALDEVAQEERYNAFIEYVYNLTGNNSDSDFIYYLNDIGYINFYKNELDKDFTVCCDKKIQKGTKVIKSFKYFIKDKKLLEDIQNKASEIIQENKVEGYLTFSVHPLDFLSVSETTYNWRSCHALDGEYRAGNLSYMTDSSTVVCYLSNGKNEYKLPRFPETVPWNSKKWRCLLFFNTKRTIMFAGRQYPFFSPGALNKVREVFINQLSSNDNSSWWLDKERLWSHWHNDYIHEIDYQEYPEENCFNDREEGNYCYIAGKLLNIYDIIHDDSELHFNDLLHSSCYIEPYYMFKMKYDTSANVDFQIGKEVRCLHCNENMICDSSSILCPDCDYKFETVLDDSEYPECSCCGSHFDVNDGIWVGDEIVCPRCFNVECFTCDCCYDNYFNSDKHWLEDIQKFACPNCQHEHTATTLQANITLGPGILKAVPYNSEIFLEEEN